MIRKNTGELTPKEERELLQEFECVDRYCDTVMPPAPKGEFEKIIAEMKKRNKMCIRDSQRGSRKPV